MCVSMWSNSFQLYCEKNIVCTQEIQMVVSGWKVHLWLLDKKSGVSSV